MERSDYIILGAGASGLMLAYRMAKDPYFDDKSILIIDKEDKKINDRTWSFWEKGEGEWDDIIIKTWHKIFFGSSSFSKTIPIAPYRYKSIRSSDFYKHLWHTIHTKSNITFVKDQVEYFKEVGEAVLVKTMTSEYTAKKIFNSTVLDPYHEEQHKYPVIQQHFVGWFVKTKAPVFDADVATFMDFTVAQKGNTRFMYVLPIDAHTALFEYTLFSKDLLNYKTYEDAIENYLSSKHITAYEIIEKEKGAIPMTSYNFYKHNTTSVLNIGTIGGWTKASTGYTFRNTSKKTSQLVAFLKRESDLSKFEKRNRFWFYDLILLDVLARDNAHGAALFSSLFNKVKVQTIFKFLDEESTIIEDIKIIMGVPPLKFIKAFFKRLF